jgi:hypothetical protein
VQRKNIATPDSDLSHIVTGEGNQMGKIYLAPTTNIVLFGGKYLIGIVPTSLESPLP